MPFCESVKGLPCFEEMREYIINTDLYGLVNCVGTQNEKKKVIKYLL